MTAVRPDVAEQRDDPAATGAGHTEEEPAPPARRHRRRRWGRTVVAGLAVAAVFGIAASAALGVFGGGSGGGTAGASSLPPATDEVTRTTLVATERYDGALGYGPQTTWSMSGGGSDAASEGSGGSGGSEIVTWLPEIGAVVERGEPVFSVNAEPMVLMYGSMPFYRPLSEGNRGPDVEQLEKNLDKLGYDGFTVDDEYTGATAEVVRQWQQDVDLPETGQFDPTRVMVADGAIRVADQLVALGDSASGQVMSYTGTDREITVELEVVDQPLVEADLPVTVTMPDGATAEATVTEVGTVATGSESEGGDDDGSTVIEVTITVEDSEELGDWDEAPVNVDIETDRREDVLAVPVGALVALGNGGHGVQVVEGGETSYVPVETGLFADGMVEITDGDVTEGMVVGVPS